MTGRGERRRERQGKLLKRQYKCFVAFGARVVLYFLCQEFYGPRLLVASCRRLASQRWFAPIFLSSAERSYPELSANVYFRDPDMAVAG